MLSYVSFHKPHLTCQTSQCHNLPSNYPTTVQQYPLSLTHRPTNPFRDLLTFHIDGQTRKTTRTMNALRPGFRLGEKIIMSSVPQYIFTSLHYIDPGNSHYYTEGLLCYLAQCVTNITPCWQEYKYSKFQYCLGRSKPRNAWLKSRFVILQSPCRSVEFNVDTLYPVMV